MKEPYRVLKGAVEITEKAEKSLLTRAKQAKSIFNYNEDAPTDRRRLQVSFLPFERLGMLDFTCAVENALVDAGIINGIGGVHSLTDWVVLVSRKGCQRQHMHTDFALSDMEGVDPDALPLGIIIGLMPQTKLDLKQGTVVFGRGDILVFRGDTLHAGSAYPDRDNIRVHCYIDSKHVKRGYNKTFLEVEND